jgi:endonuclease
MAKRIYGKTVRELFRDLVSELNMKPGEIISREQILNWFKEKYPKIKSTTVGCHCVRLSTNAPSRIHYHAGASDDLLFQLDGGRYRLYDSKSDPAPIYVKVSGERPAILLAQTSIQENEQEFAYEKDLQQFLAKNPELIEAGLQLYTDDDDEEITGLEFPAGERFIDILATDKQKNYVVIELKVSKGYDRVVGQLLRYMAWIKQYLATKNQKVRGVIVAREISDDLIMATTLVPDVTLLEYELKVTLHKATAKAK